ncbi:MAG TPA: NAD(P)-binding domain-containing protein [Clostridia bacterium]|nr:NAD(P)-binding domain-containing protein [Clostridia bacterium]
MKKIGIIGFGNLGRAFATGILSRGIFAREDVLVCSKSDSTLALARERFGLYATSDVSEAVSACDYLFLSIKKNVFLELAPSIDRKKLADMIIISCMAGFTVAQINGALGFGARVVRAMPTLAIAEADGIVAYTKTDDEKISYMFRALGFAFEVEEGDIEKVTVYAACGLGFAAYLLDAYVRAGVALGFDEATSKKIAEMDFASAIARSDYKATMAEVATKGGATEYGFAHMTKNGVDANIASALLATHRRLMGEPGE